MRHLLPLLLACLLAPSIVPVYSEGEEGTVDTETTEQANANEDPAAEDPQNEETSTEGAFCAGLFVLGVLSSWVFVCVCLLGGLCVYRTFLAFGVNWDDRRGEETRKQKGKQVSH